MGKVGYFGAARLSQGKLFQRRATRRLALRMM